MPKENNRGLRLDKRMSTLKKGKNYLVGIGIDAYTDCPPLSNAVGDVGAFVKIMQEKFGYELFNAKFIPNPLLEEEATRENIIELFNELSENLTEADNLVIYFAGHGDWIKEKGYWVPVGARQKRTSGYIPNSTIIDKLDIIKAKHVLLISDACFSGSVFLDTNRKIGTDIREDLPSRWGLTSGRKEFVSDGKVGEGSPFAQSVQTILNRAEEAVTVQRFCADVEALAIRKAPNQVPVGRPLRVKGNDIGQLVLYPKLSDEQLWDKVDKTDKAALLTFKAAHPNSVLIAEVDQYIDGIEEDEFWKETLSLPTGERYKAYLTTYPKGRYTEAAKKYQKELEQYEANLERLNQKIREWKDWEKALLRPEQSNAFYEEYLKDYPNGVFAKEAKEMLDALRWKVAYETIANFLNTKDTKYHPSAKTFLEAHNWQTDLEKIRSHHKTLKRPNRRGQRVPRHRFVAKEKIIRSFSALEEFVFVEGGTFEMGSEDGYNSEKPVHTVTVPSFYISKYQVTNEEYAAFLNASKDGETEKWVDLKGNYLVEKCRISLSQDTYVVEKSYERHPVIYVSWYGAKAYCKWKSKETGQQCRLPSEAEWEFAARGGNLSKGYQHSGSDDLEEVGWYWKNSGDKKLEGDWDEDKLIANNCKSHPVGEKQSNELGLYDLSGNVWEWCEDTWHENYEGAPNDGSAWVGEKETYRVIRGGSWRTFGRYCRVAPRDSNHPTFRFNYVGFRLVSP